MCVCFRNKTSTFRNEKSWILKHSKITIAYILLKTFAFCWWWIKWVIAFKSLFIQNKPLSAFQTKLFLIHTGKSSALPDQALPAVKLLCCDGHGASLWLLESAHAASYFKAWSSCVRRVFRLPLTTHTYLVEGHLACDFTSLRNVLLGNFVSHHPNLCRRVHLQMLGWWLSNC